MNKIARRLLRLAHEGAAAALPDAWLKSQLPKCLGLPVRIYHSSRNEHLDGYFVVERGLTLGQPHALVAEMSEEARKQLYDRVRESVRGVLVHRLFLWRENPSPKLQADARRAFLLNLPARLCADCPCRQTCPQHVTAETDPETGIDR